MSWLRDLLTGKPHQVIGNIDNPYLLRWHLVPRNRICNVYLHKFLRSDDDRALHDHPWAFASLLIKGSYWEHRADRPLTLRSFRMAPSLAFRRPETAHRVELEGGEFVRDGNVQWWEPEKPAWTVIVTGPRVRQWGFLCEDGWKFWRDFTEDDGC